MRVWIASLIFYTCVYLFCELLRLLIRRQVVRLPAEYVEYAYEFIGTIQVCAPMFDVNIVLEHYGLSGVLVEITFIELLNALVLRDARADPCPLIVSFVKKQIPFGKLAAFIGVQFAAAYASYLLVVLFWRLEIHTAHRHIASKDCESDLAVTLLYGSLVEAGGCLLAKFAEVFMEPRVDERLLSLAGASLSGLITVFGISLTGMYANPIVAWACTFNCGEVPHLAHFVVYWIAPLAAWFAADRLLPQVEKESIAGSANAEKEE
ncbi:Aquaporin [Aphelenchoides fujianensis]|nr:Aquaporin [Aphelenchoides fujianensis]